MPLQTLCLRSGVGVQGANYSFDGGHKKIVESGAEMGYGLGWCASQGVDHLAETGTLPDKSKCNLWVPNGGDRVERILSGAYGVDREIL